MLGNLVGNTSVIYRKTNIQLKIEFFSWLDIYEIIKSLQTVLEYFFCIIIICLVLHILH